MARPKAKYQRSCTVCMSTLPRHETPRPHYANGLCEMHYRREQRKKPQCAAADCGARLEPGHSRQGHCREHEPLLLQDLGKIPSLQPVAMAWAMLKGLPVGRAEPGGEPIVCRSIKGREKDLTLSPPENAV